MLIRYLAAFLFLSLLVTFAPELKAQSQVAAEVSNDAAAVEIVSGRNINIKNRFEIALFAIDTSLRNVFVEQPYAAHLAIGYHVFEWLQLQAVGGFVFVHRESSTIRTIREDLASSVSLSLPQLWQPLWNVGIDAQWAPFYGKISLFSEFDANFQVYALFGGAFEGIERVIDRSDNKQGATRFALGVGAGLRLFVTDRFAIRSEIKQSFGLNPPLMNGEQDLGLTTWLHLGISFLI